MSMSSGQQSTVCFTGIDQFLDVSQLGTVNLRPQCLSVKLVDMHHARRQTLERYVSLMDRLG